MPQVRDSVQNISFQVPDAFCDTITINVLSLPPGKSSVIQALEEAMELVAKKFLSPKPITIFIGTSPFRYSGDNANHTVEFIAGTEHLCYENSIYIDWKYLILHQYELQIVCILEELCHYIFNIKDENLVSIVVCEIYQKAAWNGTTYSIKP